MQFVAPFYLGIMYEDLGAVRASGVLAGLSGGLGFLVRPLSALCVSAPPLLTICDVQLVAVTMVFGRRWRKQGVAE